MGWGYQKANNFAAACHPVVQESLFTFSVPKQIRVNDPLLGVVEKIMMTGVLVYVVLIITSS